MWDWNLVTHAMFYSPRWRALLGLGEGSLGEDTKLWFSRIHPEDKVQVMDALRACREGGRSLLEIRHRVRGDDGRERWLYARGLVIERSDLGTPLRMLGTCADVTAAHESEARIRQLGSLYAAMSAANEAMLRGRSADELYSAICRIVVEQGGMGMAWVGLVAEDGLRVEPVRWYGEGTDYLHGIEVLTDDSTPQGRGPTGTAIRENRPVWVGDFKGSAMTGPWHERSRTYGWAASAALPICRGGRAIGALTYYSTQPGWFDEEIRAVLQALVRDIEFALDKWAAEEEAARGHAELVEAEQRFRAMVEQALAGTYIVQDELIVYANPRLAEILGFPDGEAMEGIPIRTLVASKDLARAEAQHRDLLAGRIRQTDYVFTARRRDGAEVDVGVNSSLATYRGRPAVIGLMQDVSNRRVAEEHIRRYTAQLETIFVQTVGLATTLSEMRDPYTAGHEQRVAEIAVAIGRELGLDGKTLEGLRIGGYLHDVGKMRVPAEILAKPGRLTPSEYELIKEHPRAGYDVLKEVEFPWPVAQIALQHHERIDGSGYPQGLKGEQIMLEARIIAVADVVESMSSHRPYRPGLGLERALAELERGKGSAYDPAIVDACLRLYREKGFTPSEKPVTAAPAARGA